MLEARGAIPLILLTYLAHVQTLDPLTPEGQRLTQSCKALKISSPFPTQPYVIISDTNIILSHADPTSTLTRLSDLSFEIRNIKQLENEAQNGYIRPLILSREA